MSASDLVSRLGLLMVRDFLDAQTCEKIRLEAHSARGGPATVYIPGSPEPVHEHVRKTTRLLLTPETTALVYRRLLEHREAVERHFQIALSDCEAPQFLHYREGDFFVAHQDGNTEQLQYDHLRVRRISVVIFLNHESEEPTPGTYGGGSLVLFGDGADSSRREPGYLLRGETGLLVAFRAETTHEVRPVLRGERFTIVSWYR